MTNALDQDCDRVGLLIASAIDGILDQEEESILDGHLASCSPCRETYLASMNDLVTELEFAGHGSEHGSELARAFDIADRSQADDRQDGARRVADALDRHARVGLPIEMPGVTRVRAGTERSRGNSALLAACLAISAAAVAVMALHGLWSGEGEPSSRHEAAMVSPAEPAARIGDESSDRPITRESRALQATERPISPPVSPAPPIPEDGVPLRPESESESDRTRRDQSQQIDRSIDRTTSRASTTSRGERSTAGRSDEAEADDEAEHEPEIDLAIETDGDAPAKREAVDAVIDDSAWDRALSSEIPQRPLARSDRIERGSTDPVQVSAIALESRRTAGQRHVLANESTRKHMRRMGLAQVSAKAEICVSRSGAIDSVRIVEESGYGPYDRRIEDAVEGWRFTPHRVNREPVPTCTVMTFVHSER